ncbi:MAG: hypothetical protein K6T88_00585 [Bacillus sp. (in: Bacteria)]|nr:hypothetical protein [Bacillus sp. (in: firmicutes)]
MGKQDLNKPDLFVFDEQGANEVSQQIMDSYNSGFMGEETALADSQKKVGTGTEMLGAKIF